MRYALRRTIGVRDLNVYCGYNRIDESWYVCSLLLYFRKMRRNMFNVYHWRENYRGGNIEITPHKFLRECAPSLVYMQCLHFFFDFL